MATAELEGLVEEFKDENLKLKDELKEAKVRADPRHLRGRAAIHGPTKCLLA